MFYWLKPRIFSDTDVASIPCITVGASPRDIGAMSETSQQSSISDARHISTGRKVRGLTLDAVDGKVNLAP